MRAWPFIHAAVKKGYGKYLYIAGIDSEAEAYELKKAIYNGARHHELSAQVHCKRGNEYKTWLRNDDPLENDEDGTFTLRYFVQPKVDGRKAVIALYGEDRANWPYDPFATSKAPSIDEILDDYSDWDDSIESTF